MRPLRVFARSTTRLHAISPHSLPPVVLRLHTMSALQPVSTDAAPKAVGPYAQAVKAGNLLFCSGSLGLDPQTMQLVSGGAEEQAKQALKNMSEVIKAGGGQLDSVVKTLVFFTDLKSDFAAVNAVYAEFFGDHRPARSAVQVAALPLGAAFEIEAIVSVA